MLNILDPGLPWVFLAFLLRQRETGPNGHGLETITASSVRRVVASAPSRLLVARWMQGETQQLRQLITDWLASKV